jgi:dihydroorotate dehydrogenase electron transfer subunit
MFQLKAKLLYNKRIKGNYLQCILQVQKIAKEAQPGQFVNLKLSNNTEPLLRRPFSIHRISRGTPDTRHQTPNTRLCDSVEILYEVVGPGTKIFAQKKAGEYLDVLGPLGSGFSVLGTWYPVLVAGGMGVAPLIFLAEKIITRSQGHKVTRKPLVLIGARTKKQILCEKEFKELGCDVKIATDDGSRGFQGKATDLLNKLLCDMRYAICDMQIYACGPKPMLKEISRLSQRYDIPAQLSLDEHMACGIGACLGCVVKTKAGFQRACKDGPVFKAEEIIW